MKAVMLSLRPQWCEKIFNGSKSIEVRKSRPSIPTPFTVYIYQTKHKGGKATVSEVLNSVYGGGKVIGSFVCDSTTRYNCDKDYDEYFVAGYIGAYMPFKEMCLTNKNLIEYGKGDALYGWHITEPKLFDKPRELREFSKFGYKYLGGCCVNYNCPNCIDNGWMQPPECKIDGCFLTHPPQSWCYIVEDKGETK